MEQEQEVFYQCPYCWSQASLLVERTHSQSYIEDCEVCCRPIRFEIFVGPSQEVRVEAYNLED